MRDFRLRTSITRSSRAGSGLGLRDCTARVDPDGRSAPRPRIFLAVEEYSATARNILGRGADRPSGSTRAVQSRSPSPDPARDDRVMLVRSRKSRIYFLRRFFEYPIRLDLNTLLGLGPMRTMK